MAPPLDLQDAVLTAWNTSSRVTAYLIEHLPSSLWSAAVPGIPRRTIRSIGAHLHNSRCSWVRTLGQEHGIVAPAGVDQRAVTRRQLGPALQRSSRARCRKDSGSGPHGPGNGNRRDGTFLVRWSPPTWSGTVAVITHSTVEGI